MAQQDKRVARRKKLEKARNLAHNKPIWRFALFIDVDGDQKPMMGFHNPKEVKLYVESIEDLRRRNAAEIVEAWIRHIPTGRLVHHIPPSQVAVPNALAGPNGAVEPQKVERLEQPTA